MWGVLVGPRASRGRACALYPVPCRVPYLPCALTINNLPIYLQFGRSHHVTHETSRTDHTGVTGTHATNLSSRSSLRGRGRAGVGGSLHAAHTRVSQTKNYSLHIHTHTHTCHTAATRMHMSFYGPKTGTTPQSTESVVVRSGSALPMCFAHPRLTARQGVTFEKRPPCLPQAFRSPCFGSGLV